MKDVLRVFDVDNTLLIPCNIYIYKRCKITREILVKLSPKEYSVDVLHVSQYYDFTEFDDKTRCKDSIINGKILYNDFTNGEKIAVLTTHRIFSAATWIHF